MKLAKLIKRLLVIARAPDVKYLIGLNLQAIQKIKGKPGPGEDPRTFYQALQQEATKGPIFTEATLKFMDALDLDLTKDEVKWIATRYQKKAKIKIDELRNVLDYLRAEKPKLDTLSYQKAIQNSIVWHEQFKGKADSTGEYKTKNIILSMSNGYTWVEVPAEDLEIEGNNMGHCVGGPGYQHGVTKGIIKIFSLRDSSNKPHVTVEITSKGRVEQVQGKENKEPVEKYHTYIEQLWAHLKIKHNEHTAKYITDPKVMLTAAKIPQNRRYIASNPRLPLKLMKEFSTDNDHAVCEFLVFNPSLHPSVMPALANNSDELVRAGVCAHKNLPLELMEAALRDNYYVRSFLAKNPSLPEKIFKKLAKDSHNEVRRNLAENPSLPLPVLKVLAKDKDFPVLYNVATRKDLPVDLMKVMMQSTSSGVLTALARNPNLPARFVQLLANKANDSIRLTVAERDDLSEDVMNLLAKDEEDDVVISLAQNKNLTIDLMRKLSRHHGSEVRERLLLSQRNLPSEIVNRLALDDNHKVSMAAIAHPNCNHRD